MTSKDGVEFDDDDFNDSAVMVDVGVEIGVSFDVDDVDGDVDEGVILSVVADISWVAFDTLGL